MVQKENLLIANSGYILTDGEIYSPIIDLGNCKTINDYSEITEEEYKKRLKERELENKQFLICDTLI